MTMTPSRISGTFLPRHSPPRPWTSKEIAQLRQVAPLGAHTAAEILGRTVRSVRNAAHRHRISLRQPGNRAGLILGQPRTSSWATLRDAAEDAGRLADLRARVLDGTIDIARLEARTLDALRGGTPLCPSCVCRPIAPTGNAHKAGFCDVCWRRELNEQLAHDDDLAAQQREANRIKQANSRRRRRQTGATP